jgi:hypothetical protein
MPSITRYFQLVTRGSTADQFCNREMLAGTDPFESFSLMVDRWVRERLSIHMSMPAGSRSVELRLSLPGQSGYQYPLEFDVIVDGQQDFRSRTKTVAPEGATTIDIVWLIPDGIALISHLKEFAQTSNHGFAL